MPLDKTVKTWDDYTKSEGYKALSATDRDILSKKYMAQKIASDPEYRKLPQEVRKGIIAKVRGIDQAATATPSALDTAGKEFKNAFAGNLTGATLGFKPETNDNPGILESFGGLYQNLQGGDRMAGVGQGLAGFAGNVAGQLADPAGLAVDFATAGVGGKLLKKAPMLTRAAVTGAASGAIQGGGVAALQGGNVGQAALTGAALGGGIGAFAGRTKSAPALPLKATAQAAPPPMKPRLPAGPQMLALPPARSGPMLPSDGSVIQMPGIRKPTPPVTPPGLAAPPLRLPTREQVAREGYTPEEITQMYQAAPEPSNSFASRPPTLSGPRPLALPPAGGTGWPGGVIPAPEIGKAPGLPGVFDSGALEARNWQRDYALYDQLGHEPGTTAGTTPPRDTFLEDSSPEDLARWLTGYKSALTAARQNLTRLDNVVRADKQKRGGQSGVDEAMMTEAHLNAQELPDRILELEAEITRRALRGQPYSEPAKRGAARANPTDAPAAQDFLNPKSDAPSAAADGGSFLRRLASDESGAATLEGAAGLPAVAVAGAGRLARRANEGVDNLGGKLFALPGQAAAAVVNKAAGKEVLRSGWDSVAGEDRLGVQAGEAFDWLRRQAGDDHPYFGRVLKGSRDYFQGERGLPAEYTAKRDQRQVQGRLIQQEGRQLREQLEAGLTPDQQEELYRVLNDRELTDTAMASVSEPVRQRIDSLSKELADVGSITPKAYEVHQNQYLRRLYEKYYNQEPAVSRWLQGFKKDVKGSFARGKEKPLSEKTAALFNRQWEDTGKTVGTKRVLRDAATGETREVSAGNVGNYLGTWRPTSKGKYRRDYTESEREKMGEIRRAPVAIEETFKQAGRDLANGRLLKDVASNPEWSIPAEAIRGGLAEVPDGWVMLDDYGAGLLGKASKKASANKSGLPKWGALAGHYVEPSIARDLAMAMQARDRGNLSALMGFWKKGKTVYNLKSHVNNFAQNLVALELNGASAFDLPEGAALLRSRGPEFDKLEAAGLFDNSFAATEFAGAMQGTAVGNPWNFVQRGAEAMGTLDKTMTNAYQGADDLFRAAYVVRKMRDGVPLEEAVKNARERFYNGSIDSPFIQDAGSTVLPFIKPAAWSAAEVPKMVMRNPAKVAKIAALYWGWNEISKMATGDTDERVAGRQAMYPPHQQGPGKIAQMPMRDTLGQPLVTDLQNYAPWNAFQAAESSPGGLIPQALIPGGPLVNAIELARNVDLFRGKPITDKSKTYLDQGKDYLDFAARAALPSTLASDIGIPGVTRGKLMGALQGQEDSGGRRYDAPTALANLFVKTQPFNEPLAFQKMADRYDRELADIDRQMGMAGTALANGLIGQAQYRQILEVYGEMSRRKTQEMTNAMQQARPAMQAGASESAGRPK